MAKSQGGFSIIELLVTILIFAVGLLGVASLQTTGMRLVRDADMTGKASLLASSMADKMRGNMVVASGYSGIDGSDRSCLNEDDEDLDPECTAAQEDIIDWNQEIADTLPDGEGSVTSANNVHTISVTWSESNDSTQADNERTYELVVRI